MPVAKDKVTAAIQATTEGSKYPKTLIDRFATQWAEKIDTDESIETFVSDNLFSLEITNAYTDSRVTDALNKKAKPAEPAKPEPPAPTDAPKDDMAAMLKLMMDEIKSLKSERIAETTADKFRKDERTKGIPAAILDIVAPKDEEGYEAAIERAQATWTAVGKDLPAPGSGSGTPGTPPTGNQKPQPKASEEQRAQVLKGLGITTPLTKAN